MRSSNISSFITNIKIFIKISINNILFKENKNKIKWQTYNIFNLNTLFYLLTHTS